MSDHDQPVTPGDSVEIIEPYRGFDSGLVARVVSVDSASGKVTVVPQAVEPPSVFLSVEASRLRRRVAAS
jgi:hypothetical protein